MDEIRPIARELRLARETAGLTREQFAERIGYTASMVEKVETGKANASTSYVAAVMKHVPPAEGILDRMRLDGMRRKAVGDWLRDYLEIESQADSIRWFEPNVIPGLVQVKPYMGALIRHEEALTTRLERQKLLARENPPEIILIIDEAVLGRRVGSPPVMAEQLTYLTEVPVVIQVLPTDTDTYAGLDGAFTLATVGDRTYVYVDTPAQGFTLDNREVISQVQRQWETLRGEALTPKQSRELILKVADRWKNES